jgi:hypothetical protein
MLGSKLLFVPGIIVLAAGVALMAGATGAVKTVKLSVTPFRAMMRHVLVVTVALSHQSQDVRS